MAINYITQGPRRARTPLANVDKAFQPESERVEGTNSARRKGCGCGWVQEVIRVITKPFEQSSQYVHNPRSTLNTLGFITIREHR
jgi:hypothetical protein